jgi:hypothetical protein
MDAGCLLLALSGPRPQHGGTSAIWLNADKQREIQYRDGLLLALLSFGLRYWYLADQFDGAL